MAYVYIYFNQIPSGYSLDEIEDNLDDLLAGRGEVTGVGIGNCGGNIDIDIYEGLDILQDIKYYLLSCGFGGNTILDINGKREPLST